MRFVICVLLLCTGCFAGALPGARWEAGGVAVGNRDGGEGRGRWSVGTHLNSYTSLPVEVGIGYQAEHETVFGPSTPEEAKQQMDHGPYLEIAGRLHERAHHRSFIGLRSSVLWPFGEVGSAKHAIVNTALRTDFEFFTRVRGAGGASSNSGFVVGAAYGILAVGGYVESGYRRELDGLRSFVATAGLTIRTPFVAGVGMDFNLLNFLH